MLTPNALAKVSAFERASVTAAANAWFRRVTICWSETVNVIVLIWFTPAVTAVSIIVPVTLPKSLVWFAITVTVMRWVALYPVMNGLVLGLL